MNDIDLDNAECLAMTEDTLMSRALAKAVSMVRKLQHELNDPNYQYSGRIHRQAILCRNAEIDKLREENRKLKEALKVEIIVNDKESQVQPKATSFEDIIAIAKAARYD